MGSVQTIVCVDVACQAEKEQLAAAVESRDVIGMAKGLLMASSGCSPDGAFDLLRNASQRENVKLVEVARRIVRSRVTTGIAL